MAFYCDEQCQTAAWASHEAVCFPEKGSGKQGPKNKEAFNLSLEAAQEDNAEAQFDVGYAYLLGGDGMEKNMKEAIMWLLKAKSNGHCKAGLTFLAIAQAYPELYLCHHCGTCVCFSCLLGICFLVASLCAPTYSGRIRKCVIF
jgi:hypothetical protein